MVIISNFTSVFDIKKEMTNEWIKEERMKYLHEDSWTENEKR